MALGECFTRSAVACEFFVFADFANSSRRRLLRPAVGFMDNRGSVGQELCVRLDGGADRHLNANTGPSLAASVRSLKPTAQFCRGTETPMLPSGASETILSIGTV